MMRQSRRYSRLVLVPRATLVAAGLVCVAMCLAPSPGNARRSRPMPSQPTVDPQPPLSVTVELVSLQKAARGGVVALLLKVSADVGIAEAVVSAKAPGNLIFADGSSVKTWNLDLASGGTQSVPAEIIVPQDGKYVIALDVTGAARGRPIHRGTAYKLLVGVTEPAHKIKDGAIEYPASSVGGD